MSLDHPIGLILQKHTYKDSGPVKELKGALFLNRPNVKTLKKHAPKGYGVIKKGIEYLIRETYDIPYFISSKRNVLGDNVICNVLVQDKKVIAFYIYLVQEFIVPEIDGSKGKDKCRFWVSGYFDESANFLGCGTNYEDYLTWSTY